MNRLLSLLDSSSDLISLRYRKPLLSVKTVSSESGTLAPIKSIRRSGENRKHLTEVEPLSIVNVSTGEGLFIMLSAPLVG